MDEPTGTDIPESAPEKSQADLASRLDALASRISLESEDAAADLSPLGSEHPLSSSYDWQNDPAATGAISPVIDQALPAEPSQSVEPSQAAESNPAPGGAVSESLSNEMSNELAAELNDMRSSLDERMAVLEDTLQSVCERIESLARDGISVTGEGIEKLADGVRALEARVASFPLSPTGSPAAEVDVVALSAAVSDSLGDTMGHAFNDLATAVGLSLREHTDAVAEALAATHGRDPEAAAPGIDTEALTDALVAAVGAAAEARAIDVEALTDALVAAVGASNMGASIDPAPLTEALIAVAGRVDEGHELIGTLATGVGESLRAHAEHLSASLDGTRIAVEMAVSAALQAANLAAPDGGPVLGTLESPLTRSEMAEALGEIAVRLLEGQEVIADRVDFVQGHVVTEASLRDTQHQSLAQALVTMSTASADADEIIVAEAMRTTASLEAVFHEMQAQRGLLAAVVDEVRRSIQAVDGSLGSVASALVSYLAERDRLLELERADIQSEMLVGFASGLKAADRKRSVSRISAALDQRADSRDAQKWRDAINDPIPPGDPDFDDVATLHDLLDRFDAGEALSVGSSESLLASLDETPVPPVGAKAAPKKPTKATAKASRTPAKAAAKKTGTGAKTPAKKAAAKRPAAPR